MSTAVKPNTNAATTKLAGALAKQEEPTSLQMLIQKATKELGRALPAHLSPERMTRIALTTIRLNPELSRCTPESFMGSLFVLAQLGLEPVNGMSYILPFNNNRKVGNEWKSFKEAQVIIGYKGYISLFYRHDSSLSLDVQTVYDNDEFDFEHGTKAFLRHKPAKKNRGAEAGFYAIAKLKGGVPLFHYMSKEEALEHGKEHSKTYDSKKGEFHKSSPWLTDFSSMGKKTVILQLCKILPISFELQRALSVDETSRDFRDGIDSALDMPITTTWKNTEEATSPPESEATAPQNAQTPVQTEKEQPKPEPGSFDDFPGK